MILRYYGLEEMLAHPDGDALMEPVFRAHEDGTVVVWTPTNVFGNKGTLAMLSEFAEDASVFSAQERAVIERVLPWSRMLGRRGAETDKRFISECMQRQESLVFKPTGLFGGEGVLIGREVDARHLAGGADGEHADRLPRAGDRAAERGGGDRTADAVSAPSGSRCGPPS